MQLLSYVNKTNPLAHIGGICLLTDEELTIFTANIEAVKSRINSETKFVFSVGEGFIQHETADIDYTITPIAEADLPILQSIVDTGFARHFCEGVIGYTEASFVTVGE